MRDIRIEQDLVRVEWKRGAKGTLVGEVVLRRPGNRREDASMILQRWD